jgi:hypothetical protein
VSGKKTNPDLSPEQQEQLRQWQKWQAMQKPNPPLEEQQQQLGELWRSEWKQWIPIEGAIALIEKSPIPDMTPGYARKLLNDAIASGAVTVAYANQDRSIPTCAGGMISKGGLRGKYPRCLNRHQQNHREFPNQADRSDAPCDQSKPFGQARCRMTCPMGCCVLK